MAKKKARAGRKRGGAARKRGGAVRKRGAGRTLAKARQRLAKRRATKAATPADAAANIRRMASKQAAKLSRMLNQNPGGHAAADILAALGADATTLQGYIATAVALGQVAAPGDGEAEVVTTVSETA
jgi:hypothetical protein